MARRGKGDHHHACAAVAAAAADGRLDKPFKRGDRGAIPNVILPL